MPVPLTETSRIFTYGQYLKWPEDERWELIEGVPHAMSPAPSTTHQRITGDMHYQIYDYLKNLDCEVFIAPFDVRLPEALEADDDVQTVVQPDIVVICDPDKIDDKGCRGAPDWIIEVVSPGTASKDFIQKRQLFEKHKVREYWLVHPLDHLVTVFILNDDGQFGVPAYYDANDRPKAHILPDLAIDLKTVFS